MGYMQQDANEDRQKKAVSKCSITCMVNEAASKFLPFSSPHKISPIVRQGSITPVSQRSGFAGAWRAARQPILQLGPNAACAAMTCVRPSPMRVCLLHLQPALAFVGSVLLVRCTCLHQDRACLYNLQGLQMEHPLKVPSCFRCCKARQCNDIAMV